MKYCSIGLAALAATACFHLPDSARAAEAALAGDGAIPVEIVEIDGRKLYSIYKKSTAKNKSKPFGYNSMIPGEGF